MYEGEGNGKYENGLSGVCIFMHTFSESVMSLFKIQSELYSPVDLQFNLFIFSVSFH